MGWWTGLVLCGCGRCSQHLVSFAHVFSHVAGLFGCGWCFVDLFDVLWVWSGYCYVVVPGVM